ncbi:4-hydroxybenzoyl-CoA thioesterase [Limimaricola soesokkakensis]|uniref:1,4-dihydroxy-2-naphthoyl-CoA hydrolase n=1 Tax=Limimaricola soesokkakensis TaxID=1343159 RepID=A0A1X6Z0D6_9RHOB|nr:thioesterase family protein [Limimaricola soesokkakensis]PSK87944.1 4-hydroxybenzoyl-CoA thioesterase [Limimaricola soesokkakensis]SLN37115.1 1,4-dihydroxy-2-naphthoyl-CoA hydrolase [Limimaricola soesokkakensis]
MVFTTTRKVRFEHCDPAGIVFYPRYFEMLNACIEDWFEERLGRSFGAIHVDGGFAVPTARCEVRFTAPSRIGDPLELRLRPLRVGRSSLDLEIDISSNGEARLHADFTLVHVAQATGRPASWPDALRGPIEDDIARTGATGQTEGEAPHGT